MAQEWRAGLIDRNAMLAGKFQLAQISSSNLVARRAPGRVRDARRRPRGADALARGAAREHARPTARSATTCCKIKQEYEASRLETQKAIENARHAQARARRARTSCSTSLKQSSYLSAIERRRDRSRSSRTETSTKVKKGEPLYGCKLGMVFCHKVGTVLEVLPGEVQFKHPHKDKMLRGQMVELKLDEATRRRRTTCCSSAVGRSSSDARRYLLVVLAAAPSPTRARPRIADDGYCDYVEGVADGDERGPDLARR